jgi:uncharacterized protein with von Willebrand factor type A (vWA) domain
MSETQTLENNLLNITNRDAIYNIVSNTLMKTLFEKVEDELKPFLAIPQIPLIATDSYFLHYSVAPILKNSNADKIMNSVLEFQREYVATDRYQALRSITVLDDKMSKIYSFALSKVVLEKLYEKLKNKLQQMSPEEQQEVQNILQQMQQAVNQLQQQLIPPQPQPLLPVPGEKPPVEELPMAPGTGSTVPIGTPTSQQPQPSPQPQPSQSSQQLHQLTQRLLERLGVNNEELKKILNEAGKKAEKATKAVNDIRRLVGGKDAGKQPGTLEFLTDLADAVLKQKVDVKIIELAGKIADSLPRFVKLRKTRSKHGDEIAGYRLTKNVEKALPRELALPDEVFYYKLASNGFLTKEMQSIEEGAYYVIVDKSGSMEGEKTVWARAVALALLKLAREKKRRYFLRFFDYVTYDLLNDSDPEKLLKHILEVRADGGTSIDTALRTALEDLEKHKLSELTNTIIIITDGEDEVLTMPEEFRKNNATLVAVMIQGRNSSLENIARKSGGEYLKVEPGVDGALKLVKTVK